MEAALKETLFSGNNAKDIILGHCIAAGNPYPSTIMCSVTNEQSGMVIFDYIKPIESKHNTFIAIYTNERYKLSICLKIEGCRNIGKVIEVLQANADLCKNIVPITYLGLKLGYHYTIMPVMDNLVRIIREKNFESFDKIFNGIVRQLKDISKMVVPEKYHDCLGSTLIYSDLKVPNILVHDGEPYLCDIESFIRLDGSIFMPCTLPETLCIDHIVSHEPNTGLTHAKNYKYDLEKTTSFQLGGLVVGALFPEYHGELHYVATRIAIVYTKKYWMMSDEKNLEIVVKVYTQVISTAMRMIERVLGPVVANLLNPDPIKRTSLNDLDDLDCNITEADLRDIFNIIEDGNHEELVDVIRANPKAILFQDCDGSTPLMCALMSYNDNPEVYSKIIKTLIDTSICSSADVRESINCKNSQFGLSALFYACENRITKWVSPLIENGGDVHTVRDWRNTPLKQIATARGIQLSEVPDSATGCIAC